MADEILSWDDAVAIGLGALCLAKYDQMKGDNDMDKGYTEYDFDKCKTLVDSSLAGTCSGKEGNVSICFACPYFIGNANPEKCCCDMAENGDVPLENEIFMKLYDNKQYDLAQGIDLLKRVITRLERVREQNASEALTAFLNNYCGDDKCRRCPFAASNDDCLIKLKIAALERKES